MLTARSDTPDALLTLALVAAAGLALEAVRRDRRRWAAAAGVAAGAAVLTKGAEALVGLPALCLALATAMPGVRRRRAGAAALLGGTAILCALVWPGAVSLLPGRHPWPVGSTDGTVWSTLVGYGGAARLGAAAAVAHPAIAPPGPLRLVLPGAGQLGRRLGSRRSSPSSRGRVRCGCAAAHRRTRGRARPRCSSAAGS